LQSERIVGKPVFRKEGLAKVLGSARYIDDISLPGMIFGATVRSAVPRGRVLSIEYGTGIPWDEFTVVTAKDIPGHNYVALISNDWPCLADGFVNHPQEPILLLGHPDRHLLPLAVAAIKIEYEELPSVHSIEESESGKPVVWGEDNILKSYSLEKGDVDAAFREPGILIVEGEYMTGAQEHLYIENNGAIAAYSELEGVTFWGSLQCPFYAHKALIAVTGLPEDKVRVIQVETGGAFGGKEDYPSMIGAHAALLAIKSGRPVKVIYDRMEDMAATTKRHPSRARHRTAVTKDGKLLAADIEFCLDGGAYSTLSSTVLSRATIHSGGAYYWPNIRVRSKAYATNTPPHGAFRGFGAPQALFATERQMDRVAKAVGLTPEEFRRRNLLRTGETTSTGQEIRQQIDLPGWMERALDYAGYYEKKARFNRQNPDSLRKKGIGFAVFLHGAGFTGSGERYLNSLVGVDATADGRIRVLVSSTEFGQGTNTILCQIAAESLGVDYDVVEMAPADTRIVPNSGPTVASRTAMVVGRLVHSAARGLKQTLIASGLLAGTYTTIELQNAARAYIARYGGLCSMSRYEAPPDVYWDDQKYYGEAYAAFAWAAYVAEVTVDLTTYSVTVDDFVALQEVGKVINPVLAEGQITGGVAQAIGFALYEKVLWQNGRMLNNQMTNYIMPASLDLPPIRVFFEELGNVYGAHGAKGIGELPMDGPAPAIVSAVEDAIGVSFHSIPLLPEDLFEALHHESVGQAVSPSMRGRA
jgi:CO/xanthine dehydrogenase Mo-binding subunit